MQPNPAFIDEQKDESDYLPSQVIQPLAGHIRECYTEAKSAKQQITERLLRCERQRRGEYDPETLMKIKEFGGSEVFLMLTDIKCRAAESWIKDVVTSAGESPFEISPTVIPDLPPRVYQQVQQYMEQQLAMMQQQGQEVTPEMVQQMGAQLEKEALKMVREAADDAAKGMNKRILDGLQEANWDDTVSDLVYDFVTFPSCIVKGPIVRRSKALTWGDDWTPIVKDTKHEDFYRVSPYDAFPSANATDTQDGYFIERIRFMRQDLVSMKGVPGYDSDAIDEALDKYGDSGLREITFGETERDYLSGRNTQYGTKEIIEGLEYWGYASGFMLKQWGMDGLEDYEEYQIGAVLVGEHVIKAVLNPDQMGRRPYSKSSFIRIPGAFWGQALPESMRDVQTICNTSARAIANNMGIASGPQVEITIDRLPDGEDVTNVHPFKIWQTTSDKTGGGQPAVRFFQPPMNAEPLIGVLTYFTRVADEVTGVPNYIYGGNAGGGAGRTASGLAMLMDNAAKGIKQAILNLDRSINAMITRYYYYLMLYHPNAAIKGDLKVVPSGVVRALIKDHINEKRTAFLQMTSNPMDLQIMGPEGRAKLLKQVGVGMQLDMDGVIPEEIEKQNPELEQAQQIIQQMEQELMQARQQLESKEAELEVKMQEIQARLESARITAEAQVQGRIAEGEVKAKIDSETKLTVAQMTTETQLMIAEMKREADKETAQYRQEVEIRKINSQKAPAVDAS